MRIKMPAVRIAQADADSAAEGVPSPSVSAPGSTGDTLTCGACRRAFALADILRFIQHKIERCDKESTFGHCYSAGPNSDQDDGSRPGQVSASSSDRRSSLLNARRTPSTRIHTPPPASPAMLTQDMIDDGAASSTPKRILEDGDETSTPKRRASTSPLPSSSPEEDIKPKIKQEHMMDTTSSPEDLKKSRTEVVDAESNTMHSEPSNYVCSTCKVRVHSAWKLLQHVQHVHGVKIYMEGNERRSPSHRANHSASSTSSSGSTCSAPPPPPPLRHHPLLPPPDLHSPFGLLRMPLPAGLPPLAHPSVGQTPLFSRPSHHDHRFRMEQLVSEQFRHHGLNLAAAAAAVTANSLPPHQPFPSPADRAPSTPTNGSSRDRNIPPVSQPLSLEPQLDFYSQRLRQLAGTTSPGAAASNSSSPSPRKRSPPYASPSPSRPEQTTPANSAALAGMMETPAQPRTTTPPERRSESSGGAVDITNNAITPPVGATPPRERSIDPNEEGSHSCEFCGKKFKFRSNLIVHRRAHTGEKPYRCTVCDHACAQRSKLKRHMKIHRTPEERASDGASTADDSEEDFEGEGEQLEEEEEVIEEAEDLSLPPGEQRKKPPAPRPPPASLVGELMDKFGLSNIAQYSEAYKQALQESGDALKSWRLSKDRDNNNGLCAIPPGLDKPNVPQIGTLRLKEEFAKAGLGGQGLPPHPLFNPFENPFDPKRMKLDLERGDNWWLPALHAQRPPDGLFDGLKPGGNGLLQNPLLKTKESRRNDTCEYCGKVFKNCSNLTVHRRSHTGEKPYKCELCSYACAQSSKLTRHMKTHGRLGKDVYRCRFCEMPFSVPSTLEKHMRKCVVNQSNGITGQLPLSDDSNACREEAT